MTAQIVYSYDLILSPSHTSHQLLHIPISPYCFCKIISLSSCYCVLKAFALPYWLDPGCWDRRCL